jgi:hypothetical protein
MTAMSIEMTAIGIEMTAIRGEEGRELGTRRLAWAPRA